MTHDCFVCMNKCKIRVCSKCECYAHPGCWGEYLKNSTNVYTYVYPTAVVVGTPFYTNCPQCRGKIGNVKPITRSDTQFARRTSLLNQLRDRLFSIEMACCDDDKTVLFKQLFNIILQHQNIIKKETHLLDVIVRKLKELYLGGWINANIYYYQLFGTRIPV